MALLAWEEWPLGPLPLSSPWSYMALLDSKSPQRWSQLGGLSLPRLPEPAIPLQSTTHLVGAESSQEHT